MVGSTGQNFLEYLVMAAKRHNITASVAFGGSAANTDDFALGDPETAAKGLARFLSLYEIQSTEVEVLGA